MPIFHPMYHTPKTISKPPHLEYQLLGSLLINYDDYMFWVFIDKMMVAYFGGAGYLEDGQAQTYSNCFG